MLFTLQHYGCGLRGHYPETLPMHEGEEVTGGTRQRLIHQIQWSRTVMLTSAIIVRVFWKLSTSVLSDFEVGLSFPEISKVWPDDA